MKIQIAENVKRFRVARGFTQNDLATLLSVSTQAVSRWENGQAFPDITFLPLLAKYLEVSIDELMGLEGQQKINLKKELYERKLASIYDEAENAENELRIIDIYEELGHSDPFYLPGYFQRLMCTKNSEKFKIYISEDRIVKARQMIRERMRMSTLREKVQLLNTVASWEDEDKLELWADEYELPEYMRTNFWGELLHHRYAKEKSIDKLNCQNQTILYEHIKNLIYYLTDSVSGCINERHKEFHDLQRYRVALDTLELYSTRVDDIFIFSRIMTEVRYAEALLINGHDEESLKIFSLAKEHLLILDHLPDGSTLNGSVSVLNTVHIIINPDNKFMKCVANIGGYNKNPLYDRIRNDERFIAFSASVNAFFPKGACRSFVLASDEPCMDSTWEMLLNKAKQEADALSDGGVVVMLTAKGNIYPIVFKDTRSSSDAEGVIKFFVELKKSNDTKLERLVYIWHDGGIDLPSYAFREALLKVDRTNFSAKMLLQGLQSYIVKTIQATMPKGYKC